jgi:hypothetical protein
MGAAAQVEEEEVAILLGDYQQVGLAERFVCLLQTDSGIAVLIVLAVDYTARRREGPVTPTVADSSVSYSWSLVPQHQEGLLSEELVCRNHHKSLLDDSCAEKRVVRLEEGTAWGGCFEYKCLDCMVQAQRSLLEQFAEVAVGHQAVQSLGRHGILDNMLQWPLLALVDLARRMDDLAALLH